MLEWASKKQRDLKRKAEQEAELKKSLAEKVERFQASPAQASPTSDDIGYTEVTINGKRLRLRREHITIQPLSPATLED